MPKLWQKSAASKLHPLVETYTVGEDPFLDLRIFPFDIIASKAHARGLRKIGILTAAETEKILKALTELEKEVRKGKVAIRREDEDCHTVIEQFLVQRLGDIGKKIHTGRSRNDQVLVAMRLYMRDRLAAIRQETIHLAEAFLLQARKYEQMPFPGYSHTQQAMLSSLGHYFGSFVESLIDDCALLTQIASHVDRNPLGSAAGFGVSLPLDREGTTRSLGFQHLQLNSLYCQASRGKFESAFLESLVQIMLTLGRFANDMLFFTSQECKFFSIGDALVTGSSIMPQKRNLDGLEILRGHVSVVSGHQHMVQSIASRLLSGYNRDLQLLKKPLIESTETVLRSLEIARLYALDLTPQEQNIRDRITPGIFLADIATMLAAERGIPFRDAYRIAATEQDASLSDFSLNIRSKISLGAPGNLRLHNYQKKLLGLKRANRLG